MCPTYQRKHRGTCHAGSGACYGCGQEGHQVKDCPRKNRAQGSGASGSASVQQPTSGRGDQPRKGRAFALTPGNTPATDSVVSGILPICGQPAHVLIDSGSTHSFVSHLFVQYLYVPPVPLDHALIVSLPSGDTMLCDRIYNSYEIFINDVSMLLTLYP